MFSQIKIGFLVDEPRPKQEQKQTMCHVTKHYSKQERECYNSEYS